MFNHLGFLLTVGKAAAKFAIACEFQADCEAGVAAICSSLAVFTGEYPHLRTQASGYSGF
jgi:hypothetical protein